MSALEARIDPRVPSDHPVLCWRVEHTASLSNRVKVHADGSTAYQSLHGKRETLRCKTCLQKSLLGKQKSSHGTQKPLLVKETSAWQAEVSARQAEVAAWQAEVATWQAEVVARQA